MTISNQSNNKVMSATEAIARFVFDGAVVGMGGQSIGRCSMALAHEIVRQEKTNLTLVGCNLAMSMDILVGAGSVKRTECGSGNFERYGTAFRWRKAVEEGRVEVEEYSHLGMALRFLAGSLGLPFMPSKSLLGTDILNKKESDGDKPFALVNNPWNPDDPVVLLPAVNPDVSIIHAQKADEMGNVAIEGFLTHEVEMAKASSTLIVSCEELVSSDVVRQDPARTTIPYIFVSAVVVQPWGAYPTSTYRYYEHDEPYIEGYQTIARDGGEAYDKYLQKSIYDSATFDEFLDKEVPLDRRFELRGSMQRLL